jgi:hypothetical protein
VRETPILNMLGVASPLQRFKGFKERGKKIVAK